MYIIPSIIAITIKLWLAWHARGRLFAHNPYLGGLLFALLGLNLAELMVLSNPGWAVTDPNAAVMTLTGFYVFGFASAGMYLAMALYERGIQAIYPRLAVLLVGLGILVCFIPGGIVSGAVDLGYSLRAVQGPYYWVVRVVVMGMLGAGIVILVQGSLKSESAVMRKRCTVLLFAVGPIGLFSIFIIISMMFQHSFNATIWLSLTTSIMLVLLLYFESKYAMFRFLSYVPNTREYELAQSLQGISSEIMSAVVGMNEGDRVLIGEDDDELQIKAGQAGTIIKANGQKYDIKLDEGRMLVLTGRPTIMLRKDIDLKDLHRRIDHIVARVAMEYAASNDEAARLLNVSRATFYRMSPSGINATSQS